eukprot:7225317-Ditylum_brightwellii.AAC.1
MDTVSNRLVGKGHNGQRQSIFVKGGHMLIANKPDAYMNTQPIHRIGVSKGSPGKSGASTTM